MDNGLRLARMQFQPKVVRDMLALGGWYIGYIPDAYADKAGYDNAYNLIRTDLTVGHGLNTVSLQAVGEYVKVTSKDKKLQLILQSVFDNIKNFSYARKSLITNMLLFGLALQRKYYEEVEFDGFEGKFITIKKLQEVSRQRLRIERDNTDRYKLYWTLFSPKHEAYIILEDRAYSRNIQEGFAIQDYMWLFNDYDEEYPYFYGISPSLYPYVYAKSLVMQYWRELCEFCGGPIIAGMIDLNKASYNYEATEGMPTAASRQEALLKKLEDMRARKVIVLANSDAVKMLETGSIGNNILKEFVTYVDEKILLYIIGAELTTKASHVGSFALGEIHKEQTINTSRYLRERLIESIQTDIVTDFLWLNRFALIANGIKFPFEKVEIEISSEREEIKTEALKEDLNKKAGRI